MEAVLSNLIVSLKSASQQLNGQTNPTLQEVLHNTENLPDQNASRLALETLDLLSELRLLLEPRQLILADHFMGDYVFFDTKSIVSADSSRLHGYQSSLCCSGAEYTRYS